MQKFCNKCKEWKDVDYFSWNDKKRGYRKAWCKSCNNKNNKLWMGSNKEYRKSYSGKRKEIDKRNAKNWWNSELEYNSKSKFRKEIELYEEIKESSDGNIMCKCAYCGEWFEPTKQNIYHRINAIYGYSTVSGEARLYCSEQCKQNCPIYRQQLYAKYHKPATSREVQPELRQMVFARDNYTCQKCSTHRDNLEVGIHCHHKEGILWEPLQSADMDMCTTLCEDCHKEVHGIDGCGYQDMRCTG